MSPQVTTLSNGLRIITVEQPGQQTVSVSILVGAGSRYEQFERNGGVSHFLEHLLFKGTTRRPSTQQIATEIDAVGGYHNAYTDYDHTNYYIKLPTERFELAADVLADMLTDSLLDTEEIDRERGTVIEELHMLRDNPGQFVETLTPPLLWPGSPLAHEIIGSEEVVGAMQRADLAGHLKKYYVPSNMVVSVAGGIEHERVVEVFTGLLGGLTGGTVKPPARVGAEAAPERVSAIEQDTNQAHVVLSARVPAFNHADSPALNVLTTVLGRGMSSRLFINVRERLGLVYAISASWQTFTDTGDFSVYAGVNLEKVGQAIVAIRHELARLRDEPVGADELAKAKQQIRGRVLMGLEDNSNVAQSFGAELLVHSSTRTPDQILAEVEAVSAEDLQRIARTYLTDDALRMGIIAPSEQVKAATDALHQL